MGVMLANFQSCGSLPWSMEDWKIKVSTGAIWNAKSKIAQIRVVLLTSDKTYILNASK